MSSPSAFTAGEVRDLCPPALKWPLAIVRSSVTPANQSPPDEKNTTLVQWWSSEFWSDWIISLRKVKNQILTWFQGFTAPDEPCQTPGDRRLMDFTDDHYSKSQWKCTSQYFEWKNDMIKMGCNKRVDRCSKSLGWFMGGWKICCQSSRFMLLYHIIQRKKTKKPMRNILEHLSLGHKLLSHTRSETHMWN